MSQLQVTNSEEPTMVKVDQKILVWADHAKEQLLIITFLDESEVPNINRLADSLIGNLKPEITIVDMSKDSSIIIEKFNQLLDLKYPKEKGRSPVKNSKPLFTNRELEILQLIAREYTNEEIADKLCLAKRTVDNHRVNLMQRANAKNTAGLMSFAFRNGLLV
jgi:DNA-binding CsgD family transcriptional regulator